MICLPRVLPLIELELRDKNERVGHDEGKLIIPDFRVFGHLMTLQASSMTEHDHMIFAGNF